MIFALDLEGVLAPEIWPILGRYTERSADPSLRPSGARAARVFVWAAVSPQL